MSGFIAKRDLSEKDFANFSRQFMGSFERERERINHYRKIAKQAEANAQSFTRALNRTKADALRHGVELPE